MTTKKRAFSFFLLLPLILSACSGSESLSSNSNGERNYSHPFRFMEKAVKGAIDGSGLKVGNVSETKNPTKIIITVVRSGYASSRGLTQESGEVHIVKLSKSKTKIEIFNPDYEYTVPQRQRQDYQKVLFPRIEKLVEMNS